MTSKGPFQPKAFYDSNMSSISYLMVSSNMSSRKGWRLARERAAGSGFYKCLKVLLFLPNACGLGAGGTNRLRCFLCCAPLEETAVCPGFGLETLLQGYWTAQARPV